MIFKIIALIAIALFMVVSNSLAGIRVVTEFQPGGRAGAVVLPHLTNKGLVAEFMDPDNTGIGRSVGYLLWRELLTAISDQAGAGVILAQPPAGKRIVDLLKANYHLAALEIATHQQSPMVLWGAVQEQGKDLFINTYLTLIPEIQANDLALEVNLTSSGLPSGWNWQAEIKRTRFNFSLLGTSREILFRRPLITRTKAPLLIAPEKNASIVASVNEGEVLQAVDMKEQWFKVEQAGGGTAFVDINNVELPPKTVFIEGTKIRLRSGPGTDYSVRKKVDLNGNFQVLDMRYRVKKGLWYKVKTESTDGWVAAFLVTPRFSVSVIHFMAGLFRYRAKRYQEAYREFKTFIETPDLKENNTSLATANQLMGASCLMMDSPGNFRCKGLSAFDDAVRLTPYDPAAYNLRAIASIGVEQELGRAVRDLGKSLDLDAHNTQAQKMLWSFDRIFSPHSGGEVKIMFRVNNKVINEYNLLKQQIE